MFMKKMPQQKTAWPYRGGVIGKGWYDDHTDKEFKFGDAPIKAKESIDDCKREELQTSTD